VARTSEQIRLGLIEGFGIIRLQDFAKVFVDTSGIINNEYPVRVFVVALPGVTLTAGLLLCGWATAGHRRRTTGRGRG
jgi:hypothetical protein